MNDIRKRYCGAVPLHGNELEQPAGAGPAGLLCRKHAIYGRVSPACGASPSLPSIKDHPIYLLNEAAESSLAVLAFACIVGCLAVMPSAVPGLAYLVFEAIAKGSCSLRPALVSQLGIQPSSACECLRQCAFLLAL